MPFKYDPKEALTKDPDVNDFVRALMKHCEAYNCYMALLVAAKGKFADLGKKYKEEEDRVDRKISRQREDAKDKLAFLSDPKYLTFLGRLPYEGGKLTKIIAFSRNAEATHLVKMVTRDFGLPEIPDRHTVDQKAFIVSIDSVTPKLVGHPSLKNIIHFINETEFTLKLICGTVGKYPKQHTFTNVVGPRSSYERKASKFGPSGIVGVFFVGGYMLIYLDGELRADDKIHDSDVTRVIEFSYFGVQFLSGINIQDKTGSEFTEGKDTYKKNERQ